MKDLTKIFECYSCGLFVEKIDETNINELKMFKDIQKRDVLRYIPKKIKTKTLLLQSLFIFETGFLGQLPRHHAIRYSFAKP